MKRELDAVSGTLANMIKTQADDNKFTSIDGGTMVIEEAVFKNDLSNRFFDGQCTIELRHRFQQFDASGFSTGVWRLAHSLVSWTPEMFAKFARSNGLEEHEQIQLSEGDWISCCSLP